ncbi:MAG: alpha/beta hydrolase [Taibaiella sp.]|nr:alpha/beta hydrolase [Taibaiella sp.]
MIYTQTNNFPRIAYNKTGSGPSVMLIHGFPERNTLWRNLVPLLADRYMLITPDIPGTGESLPGSEQTSIEGMAHFIKAIIDNEKIEEIIIVGHSMGGYIALAFAALYPENVGGLSLVHSTANEDSDEKKHTRMKTVQLIRNGAKDMFLNQMVPNLFAAHFKEYHPDLLDEQITRGKEVNSESMMAFNIAMAERPDRKQILRDATFPIQWIIGKEDMVIPCKETLAQSTLSNTTFVSIYEECGHMSMLETPGKLAADLDRFFNYCFKI